LRWFQNQSQTNAHNLNNIRRENTGAFRKVKRLHVKGKSTALETNN